MKTRSGTLYGLSTESKENASSTKCKRTASSSDVSVDAFIFCPDKMCSTVEEFVYTLQHSCREEAPTKFDRIRKILKVYDFVLCNLPYLKQCSVLYTCVINKAVELQKDIPHMQMYETLISNYVCGK